MNKRTAEKVKELVEKELNEMVDEMNRADKEFSEKHDVRPTPIEKWFKVSVRESEQSKNWFGVSVATDSEIYELFYDFNEVAHNNIEKLEKAINSKMGKKFTGEEHYFEKYGMGIIEMF